MLGCRNRIAGAGVDHYHIWAGDGVKRSPLQRKTPLKRTGIKRKPKSALQKRKDNVGSKYWKSKADKEWGEIIRAVGECEKCGAQHKRLEAHHLLTRSRVHLRHKLENGMCLCTTCHKYGKESAHEDPVAFSQWLGFAYPERYAWVSRNRHKTFAGVKPDYKAAYEYLLDFKGRMA